MVRFRNYLPVEGLPKFCERIHSRAGLSAGRALMLLFFGTGINENFFNVLVTPCPSKL